MGVGVVGELRAYAHRGARAAALLLCQNLAGLAELLNRKKMAAPFLVALAAEGVIWTRRWLEGERPDGGQPALNDPVFTFE